MLTCCSTGRVFWCKNKKKRSHIPGTCTWQQKIFHNGCRRSIFHVLITNRSQWPIHSDLFDQVDFKKLCTYLRIESISIVTLFPFSPEIEMDFMKFSEENFSFHTIQCEKNKN